MVDVSQISAAFASLQAMKDITSAIIGLRDGKLIDGKVREFNEVQLIAQRAIFEVNEERAALIETVSSLKKELLNLKEWNADKDRYQLHELTPGILVYALKPTMDAGEPSHILCTNCYSNGHKSILQGQSNTYAGWETKKCHRCSLELRYLRKDLPQAPRKPQPTRGAVVPEWMSR